MKTLEGNPELSSQGLGPNFTSWQRVGIIRIHDLFEKGRFRTFESLKTQYHISKNDHYKYLQVRHYVYEKTNSLDYSNDSHPLDEDENRL